jgi:hypothetical protein
MKECYNNDNLVTKKKIQFLPVYILNILKVSKEYSHEYEENLKIKSMLPVYEDGRCNIFGPRKAKCVFSLKRQNN